MIELFLASIALIFAFLSVVFAARAAADARLSARYCESENKRAKLVRLEAEITELSDSLESVRESLKKLRSRQGMRDLRERRKNEPEKPTFDNTPEGRDAERAELERELSQRGMLSPKIHQIRSE